MLAFTQSSRVAFATETFSEMARLFEDGTQHVEQLSELNRRLHNFKFAPLSTELFVRTDRNTGNPKVQFFYHPNYINELLKSGRVKDKAEEIYNEFCKKKKQADKSLLLNVQTIAAGKTARIELKTKGTTNIGVIAQPKGRISAKFGDSTSGKDNATDLNAHKGALSYSKKFPHQGYYTIYIDITNVMPNDISVTLITD